MGWAVIYVRPGPDQEVRRTECAAEAMERGLGIQETTTDPARARELYECESDCELIAPPEQFGDVFPGVIAARRAHRLRRRLGVVLAPVAVVWDWLRQQPAHVAAGAAGVAGMILLIAPEPPPEHMPPPMRPPEAIQPAIPGPPAYSTPLAPSVPPTAVSGWPAPTPPDTQVVVPTPAPEPPAPPVETTSPEVVLPDVQVAGAPAPVLPVPPLPSLPPLPSPDVPDVEAQPALCLDLATLEEHLLELCVPP